MLKHSWLKSTKQVWKFKVFIVLLILAFLSIFYPNLLGIDGFFNFSVISAFAILWAVLTFKCPYCGYKIIKHYFTKEKFVYDWFINMLNRKSCPSCGKQFPKD
jgi:predicted RNA-binding Zn-ribbon protein involved in translation (DUF1610 family)